jgi:hypothetical protein
MTQEYGYLYPSFTPEYGASRAILSQEERDRNAALIIAQKKADAAAANAPRPPNKNSFLGGTVSPKAGYVDLTLPDLSGLPSLSNLSVPSFDPKNMNPYSSLKDSQYIKDGMLTQPGETRERFIPAPIKEGIPLPGTNQILPGLGGNPNTGALHTMPDGTVMPGATHEEAVSDPLLMQNQTGDKRNKTSFADFLMSKQNVGPGQQTLGSKLVRMGAAMQAGNMQGGLSGGMAAMGQEYGNIQNEGIANDLSMAAARAKAMGNQDNGLADTQNLQSQFENALAKFDEYSSVTGSIDNILTSALDSQGILDPSREAFRIELRDIVVKSTLLNTANTKGAISDKEMALFQSSVPSMAMDEDVWRAWLRARIENLREVQQRINNGVTVGRGAGVSFTNTYQANKAGMSTATSSFNKQAPANNPAATTAPSPFTQAELDLMGSD